MSGEILGAYRSSGGGRIYLNPAGNLEAGAAAGTLFHEECHWWLSRTTALGVLQSAMEMALYASEDLAAAKQQIRCSHGMCSCLNASRRSQSATRIPLCQSIC